jgi:hypothetical protein
MNISPEQKKALEHLWFIFGNYGPKCTMGNHKFIQGILERGEDDREFYRHQGRVASVKPLTKECEDAVDEILNKKD